MAPLTHQVSCLNHTLLHAGANELPNIEVGPLGLVEADASGGLSVDEAFVAAETVGGNVKNGRRGLAAFVVEVDGGGSHDGGGVEGEERGVQDELFGEELEGGAPSDIG